jgi:molybdopterin-guanine dinucleotide biosynthesis protein A
VLTGAILVGGQSRRFGRNKILEVFQGKRLVDRGIDALRPFCNPVFTIAGDLSLYRDLNCTLIQDVMPGQGPLGGIHAALMFSPHDWVLVRAGDMPWLNPELIEMMLGLRGDSDAVVPVCNSLYEPLSALYNRRCLHAVARALEASERRIVAFYPKIKVRDLSEDEWRKVDSSGLSFKNINTPEDWGQLDGSL